MSILSERLNLVKPSPTLMLAQKAAMLKRQGVDIVSLVAGEPYCDTPLNVKQAGSDAIMKYGATKYTNVDGTPELKAAVQGKFERENGLKYALDEIIVGTGAKQVIYNLFMASINPGDEVIIPAPYWVSYPEMVLLCEGTPIEAVCTIETNFKLTPEILEPAITSRTKWLLLNSPNNPSGMAYTKEELEKIAIVLRKYPNVYVMSDDIYEHIMFDGVKFYTLAQVAPDLKDRIFIVNGVSKAYSMTGWRIGYGAGPKNIVKAMTMIQSHSTSNPSSVSQMAAIEALNGPQDFIKENGADLLKKRDAALKILQEASGVTVTKPDGAFYLFPKCDALFGRTSKKGMLISNSYDMAEYLLDEAHVALMPGAPFGLDQYLRLSYATSLELVEEGCRRIRDACNIL